MLDGVSVVGAWALHELVEVVRLALLGLLAHAIHHGDQCRVGRSTLTLLVLFAPMCGGAFVWVRTLGFDLMLASVEDRSDCLLAGGMVGGNVEQVMGGMGLQAAKLMD